MVKVPKSDAAILRQKAVELLNENISKSGLSSPMNEAEMHRLIHELKVHQIELEMQNDELMLAKEEAELSFQKYIDLKESVPTEEELHENNLRLELAMRAAKMAWWKMDCITGQVTFGSRKAEMLGYLPEKFVHFTDFTALLHPDDYERTMKAMQNHMDGLVDKYEVEYRMLTKSNGYQWFYDIGSVVKKDCDGKPLIVAGLVVDIGDRKRAEVSLLASETRYRRLFESAKDGILILDAETGMIADVNPFLVEMLGYSEDQFRDKAIWEIGFFKDIVANQEKFLELQQKEYVRYDNLPLETAYGKKINVEFVSNVYLVDNKEVIQCNIRDITKRKKTEMALRISETHLRTLVQSIPDLIWLKDTEGVYLSCNTRFERFFGAGEDDIVGKTDYDFVDRNLADFFRENDRKAMTAGKPTSNEEWVTFADDGHREFLDTIKTPMYDINGKLIGVLGIGRDITERKKAENALLESEIRYRAFFENSMDAILLTDSEGKTLSVNQAACSMFGFSEEEHFNLGRSGIEDVTDTRLSVLIEERNRNGKARGEVILLRKDGASFPAEISTVTFKNQEGMKRSSMIIRDVTVHKKDEQKVRESEKRFRAIFDQAPIAIALIDLQGHPIISNLSLSKLLGYSSDEFRKMKFTEFTYPDDIDKDVNQFTDLLAGKISGYNMEKRYFHKNGGLIWANLFVTTLSDDNGMPGEIIGMVEDITDKKRAETKLRNSEERFKVLFDYAPDAYFLTDLKGSIIDGNFAAVKLMGYNKNELVGKNFFKLKLISPYQFLKAAGLITKNVLGQATGPDEFVLNQKNGSQVTVEISTYPVKIQDQSIVLGIARDITERKSSEKEIAMLAHSLKSINECVSITDPDNKIIFVNESFLKTYGYEINELLGKNISVVRSQANEQMKVDEILPATIQGAWQGELLNRRKDGSEFPIYLSTTIIKDKDGKPLGLIGVAKDISERKERLETLRKLSSAIEQTVDSIMITDRKGTIEYVNHAFETQTGYSSDDALGKTPRILKSGTYDHEFYERLWKTILTGKVFKEEIVNKNKNGDLYDEEKTISPIFDKNKYITHFVATGVNITARKIAEKELIEAKNKAEESDRLKSAFLANMSHEVRTPLNSIIGFSELLADPDFDGDDKDEFIQHIIASGNNLLTIISDIMDISKLESGEITIRKSQVNARRYIENTIDKFSIQTEGTNLELRLIVPENSEETLIFADTERLNQIFNNLISNAFKFTTKGRIEIGYQQKDKMVEFFVRDSGIGIPAEYHTKIFDRFRQVDNSNSRKFGGNGLGLAISKNLVELMGGKIRLESEPGVGSVFYFTVPKYTSK